jgi:poly-gamma-glutamate synthase PgsB/CapB
VNAGCLAVLILYFWQERVLLDRRINNIPLRICVTGARGKSSVVRLITAILRQEGKSVLAKTTGSQPVVLLPSGAEEKISRKGPVSILEQKRILKAAEAHSVQAAVFEMMSIRPESLRVEAQKLLKPHLLAITNFRCDHREHWGETRDHVVSALQSALTPGCTVFLPEEENEPELQKVAEELGAKVELVPPLTSEEFAAIEDDSLGFEFEPNSRLALAMAQHLGVDRAKAARSLANVVPDAGSLRAWRMDEVAADKGWCFVNAFAANDPESTRMVLTKLMQVSSLRYSRIWAVLNLRSDRSDRTLQWIEAFRQNQFPELSKILVTGPHAAVFRSKIRRISPGQDIQLLKARTPEEIMHVLSREASGALVVGMGNLGGTGEALIEYCQVKGTPYAV